jgi:hypothetical protein
MLYKLLNTILAAARQGDSYAREMLCRMYKIYYKKEYNQLKRFRQISYDELRAFENEEEIFEETAARILTICPFMGIEILDDCEFAAKDVEEILNDEEFQYSWKRMIFRLAKSCSRKRERRQGSLYCGKRKRTGTSTCGELCQNSRNRFFGIFVFHSITIIYVTGEGEQLRGTCQ